MAYSSDKKEFLNQLISERMHLDCEIRKLEKHLHFIREEYRQKTRWITFLRDEIKKGN